jgi:type II secretion system protein N
MTREKLLPIAGYAGLFFAAFFLFCYWTFPYERVALYLVDQVAKSGRGYTLEIGELSPYWLSGVELTNVTLRKPETQLPVVPAGKDKPAAPSGIQIRDVRARLGIFALLFGKKSVNFDAAFDEGEMEGTVSDDGETKHVEATLDKVDLAKFGALEALLSLPVKGSLSGDIDVTLGKDPKNTVGTVKLTLGGLTVGDGKAKLKLGSMGGLTVDPVEAGNVQIELDVKDGLGTVKKMSADGKDLELKGSGDVRFADPVGRSRVSVLMAVKFTDSYRNKSSRTKAMFSLLDSGMPEVNAAKTPEGALQFRLVGTLASVRALPQGSARLGGAAPAGRAPAAAPLSTDDEGE